MTNSEWESAVIEAVADSLQVSYGDASSIVEAQPFCMQQSWGRGLDAQQTADDILAAGQLK